MVRQGTSVEAHQWSAAQNQWTKVGDVVGSSGGSSGTKTIYEGEVRSRSAMCHLPFLHAVRCVTLVPLRNMILYSLLMWKRASHLSNFLTI